MKTGAAPWPDWRAIRGIHGGVRNHVSTALLAASQGRDIIGPSEVPDGSQLTNEMFPG